jgi:DHA1 family bicyclomycin/chloramphenicol resistance-like MFS transporter
LSSRLSGRSAGSGCWRGVFGVLAVIGLLLFLLAWFLPETLPPERRTRSRLRKLAADSRTLVRDRQYVGYILASALGNAAGVMLAALCVGALPCVLLIAGPRRRVAES